MYCVDVFFLLSKYSSTSSNPASCIAVSKGGYYQLLSIICQSCFPVICLYTLCWNPPRSLPMWGVIKTSPTQKEVLPAPPPWRTSPTLLVWPPPLPRFSTTTPNYSLPSSGSPPPPSNHHIIPSWSYPGTLMTLPSLVVCQRSLITLQCSHASSPPPADAISAPPPWLTWRWWCGGHSGPPTVPAYHNGGTIGRVGFPSPVWPWSPLHYCTRNVLWVVPLLSPSPTPLDRSVLWYRRAWERYMIRMWIVLWGGGCPTDPPLPLPCQRHVASDSGPLATPPPGLHHILHTEPLVSDRTGRRMHPMWYVAHKLRQTVSPLRSRSIREYQPSSWRIQIVTLSPLQLSITCIEWCSLHSHIPKIYEQHLCIRFYVWPTADVLLVFIFLVQTLFLSYSVSWVVEFSNMCDIFLFIVLSGPPHVFSLIKDFWINTLAKFSKNT